VFSPSTLASSLGMAYLGAHGATAAAMARVLHLPATTGNEAGLRARTRALASLDGPNVQVSGSNEVWDAQPSLPSYLNALATAYQAGAGHLPADPGQAATEINDAIAKATGGQITNLLSPDQLRGIGWVLTSAMYLKAKWATPFEAAMTEQLPFTTASRTRIEAPFMTADGVRTGSADGWTSVVLPYQGGKLSLVAMLPPAAGSSCAVPSAGATAALASGAITGSVALPKVDLRTKEEASGLLKALGMGIAFGQGADFTGISANACCIGFVQQAATLRLDEKGTVASAAAATGVVPTSMRQPSGPQVVFNRPYLLLITTSGGEPLFLARVANPAGS
jgi:serpin B